MRESKMINTVDWPDSRAPGPIQWTHQRQATPGRGSQELALLESPIASASSELPAAGTLAAHIIGARRATGAGGARTVVTLLGSSSQHALCPSALRNWTTVGMDEG